MSDPDPLRAPRVFGVGYDHGGDDLESPLRAPPPRRIWPWVLGATITLFLTPPAVVLALRWLPVPTTAFMLQSPVQPVRYQWVPAEQIPEALRRAVVAAEDQKFWTHGGFDFEAIEKALEHNRRHKRVRGASTITQQVAKNLFLWPSRSYVRKGLEVTFTVLLELMWPKERILEVYLNVAEFGPGVYGVQAAGRKFFGKDAAQLSAGECAQLAAVLPNPRRWRAAHPGRYVQSRTDWILRQLGQPPRFALTPVEEPLAPGPVGTEDGAPGRSEEDYPPAGDPGAEEPTAFEGEEAPPSDEPALETLPEDEIESPEEDVPGDTTTEPGPPEEPAEPAAAEPASAS